MADTNNMEPVTTATDEEEPVATANCLTLKDGIASTNECRISGDRNKCPAASSINYKGEVITMDAQILCPLDSVGQSDWVEASQNGLCDCEVNLLDATCGLIEQEMDCECFACPFGMKVGFAYYCTTEIAGPCKSYDCFGQCNGAYDPGNLVGRETIVPTTFDTQAEAAAVVTNRSGTTSTVLMVVALFRMIMS
ncbi:MAG: hypothetical protein ACI8RD_007732 [Bacillariaceae sp.]|jgi:hypothetical protein